MNDRGFLMDRESKNGSSAENIRPAAAGTPVLGNEEEDSEEVIRPGPSGKAKKSGIPDDGHDSPVSLQ